MNTRKAIQLLSFLLFLSLLAIFYLIIKPTDKKVDSDASSTEVTVWETNINQLKQDINHLIDQHTNQQQLLGLPINDTARATVYSNEKTRALYVDPYGLPVPETGYRYQLWQFDSLSIFTNLGLINRTHLGHELQRMTDADPATTFGITIEPESGSSAPRLEKMIVVSPDK